MISFDPNKPREIPVVRPKSWGSLEDRVIDAIQFGITTHCNRMCPGCCCNIPYLEHRDHTDVDFIQWSSQYFQGIRLLQISGGEPTIHPDFEKITTHAREWFQPQMLMLVTNGARIVEYADILGYYDHIRITRYTENSYPGSPSNGAIIDEFKQIFQGPSRIYGKEAKHRLNRGGNDGFPCGLGFNDLGIIQWNLLYPCCAAPGSDPSVGIPITAHWREEIRRQPLPCRNCAFSISENLYRTWKKGDEENHVQEKARFNEAEAEMHEFFRQEGVERWRERMSQRGICFSKTPKQESLNDGELGP